MLQQTLLRICLSLGLFLCGLAHPAAALESAPVSTARTIASLITDTNAVAPGTPFRLALHLRLAPGWHTYWRNPGDAGIPPDLEVHLPDGAKAGPIDWPAPARVHEGDLMTYAYTGDLLLPLTITPAADHPATHVEAEASWLVCKDICIPEQGRFDLDIPSGSPAPSAQAALFTRAAQTLPMASPWKATIAPDGRLWIRGEGLGPQTVAAAAFIPEEPATIVDAAPQPLTVRQGGFVLKLALAPGFNAVSGLPGLLEVRDSSGQHLAVDVVASPGPAPPSGYDPIARIMALAFLGGLILNLMPCVFPVLAIKALSFAEGASRGRAAGHAVAYSAGVLTAFAVLGSLLIALRDAGAAAGWGFQFQSPAFVAAMAWLLFTIGLNLSGVFHVGSRLSGAGDRLTRRNSSAGSFFTGLLAVTVATPCTAPFMGAAIAGALAESPVTGLFVFLALGAGMATPYATLVAMPGLGRVIPRPGPWMERLRQLLAFPMYAAAAWLLWVISQEAGPSGVLGTAAGFVLIGFAAWAIGATQGSADKGRRLGQSAAAAAALTAIAVLGGLTAGAPVASLAVASGESFSVARLTALRQQGRPVFVDMTAAWCVTCLVNEHVTLDTPAIQKAFAARNVALLRGDWTRQDPAITRFLRQYQRDGVPLYVYFPPRDAEPVLLPQILTQSTVLAALDRG